MSQELFADRIGDITVANGMVRIEFLSLKTQNADTQEIEFTVSHRLVVPLTSFKEIVGRQSRLMEKLAEQAEQADTSEKTKKKNKESLQ
jgi:hypothetical protein